MNIKHPMIREGSLTLRRYQEAVVSRAIDANTMVVLPTGLGKTVIAAVLAAHRLYEFPGSKVLFLAPTRPLAVQHAKSFLEFLSVEGVVILTGKDPVSKRKELWEQNQVILATPQTIANDILRGLDMSELSLVIFDECHRAVGNYAYVPIAKEYMSRAHDPRILALTASPSSDEQTVRDVSENLFIERVEAKTEKDPDVSPYVADVKTRWVRVDLPEEFQKIKKTIEQLLRYDLKELKSRGYLDSASLDKVSKRRLLELQGEIRTEIRSGGGTDSYTAASLAASAMKINHALELLETQGITALESYLGRLKKQKTKAVKRLFSNMHMVYLLDQVSRLSRQGVTHPKIERLIQLVCERKDKKILIFTQYRDTVEKIIDKLNESDILAREFVGQAVKDGKRGMSQKEQAEVLENFRAGKYTALCATSVAEEGIDIPRVDLVIFYEPIPSEIRSIQRRGRTGRNAAGEVIVLMARGTRDEAYYWAARSKEKKMSRIVSGLQEGNSLGIQKKLAGYISDPEDAQQSELKIFVDFREKNMELLTKLKASSELNVANLPVGDFILSERVGVERKSQADLLSSLLDKRLMSQAKELSENFTLPVIIVEGSEDLYSLRDIHPNAIRGALAALSLDLGLRIFYSRDPLDTAELLLQIARREQIESRQPVSLRGEKKLMSLGEMQIYLVESLPTISAVLARRLLEKFGSVRGVFSASEKELTEVEGIGKTKAARIVETINSDYGG